MNNVYPCFKVPTLIPLGANDMQVQGMVVWFDATTRTVLSDFTIHDATGLTTLAKVATPIKAAFDVAVAAHTASLVPPVIPAPILAATGKAFDTTLTQVVDPDTL